MVIKYRRKVRNDEISERAKEIFEYIAPGYGIVLEEWNHDTDHVHVMFCAQPKTERRKFINACKSANQQTAEAPVCSVQAGRRLKRYGSI